MKEKIEAKIEELEKAKAIHQNNEIFSHNQVIAMSGAISELKKLIEEDKPKQEQK